MSSNSRMTRSKGPAKEVSLLPTRMRKDVSTTNEGKNKAQGQGQANVQSQQRTADTPSPFAQPGSRAGTSTTPASEAGVQPVPSNPFTQPKATPSTSSYGSPKRSTRASQSTQRSTTPTLLVNNVASGQVRGNQVHQVTPQVSPNVQQNLQSSLHYNIRTDCFSILCSIQREGQPHHNHTVVMTPCRATRLHHPKYSLHHHVYQNLLSHQHHM